MYEFSVVCFFEACRKVEYLKIPELLKTGKSPLPTRRQPPRIATKAQGHEGSLRIILKSEIALINGATPPIQNIQGSTENN